MKGIEGRAMFTVIPSKRRKYGYAIQAPADVTWAMGPGNTFGWFRRKRDAQRRCDELNRGRKAEPSRNEGTTDDD